MRVHAARNHRTERTHAGFRPVVGRHRADLTNQIVITEHPKHGLRIALATADGRMTAGGRPLEGLAPRQVIGRVVWTDYKHQTYDRLEDSVPTVTVGIQKDGIGKTTTAK